ncbi:asparagine synthase (glutamine-hydrolyzing) [Oceanidesulfovibrio indonesiensis]|uniref:asparagine synthase (glutamine-hydrolyzing) n=1 Tax=Oceanidesulfovibrio indonesiensis TaxID=54767 RepID=A0A7M3MH11_9BACT|nr:asparagine synthase (glutamine-hydrolyzing) [Oceanidesulfovibrio indonesiensis]TVM18765.1 asparagine synthase (glutamine-hydrolyzing) [Oceanidesulfovibrio indonesiensis]
MCGIVGFLSCGSRCASEGESREWLQAMTDSLEHRGPDGQGMWVRDGVALGHRRLSIIDLHTGAQPMEDSAGRAVAVFNGEIYNYIELREKLRGKGFVFRTDSDTEVLLCSYLAWGPACLDRLEGMFAFAIWDKQERRLFAARDRFGKKPFYYTIQNGIFAFASELTTLTRHPLLRFSVERSTLARFLAYEYIPAPECIYRQVRKLLPSHALVYEPFSGNNADVRLERYWEMPLPDEEDCPRYGGPRAEDYLCEELRELIQRAVKRRLVSDVPLGLFLSGGLDSSTIAAFMTPQVSQIKSFSIAFDESSYDESDYAQLVSEYIGTDHHEYGLRANSCGEYLPEIVSRIDEPLADPSLVPTFLLAKSSRRHVTVALSGDGPDELFAGYEYYYGFRMAKRLLRIPASIRAPGEWATRFLPASANYVNYRFAAEMFLAGMRCPSWMRVQRWLTAMSPEMQETIWFNGSKPELGPDSLFEPTRLLYESYPSADEMGRAVYVFARQYMADYILMKVDRASMMHSLEVRAPFLDRELAEFACRLPLSWRLRGSKRKWLLKKAMAPYLPAEIINRPKRGLLIPTAQWLRTTLKPCVEELMSESALAGQQLFAPRAVRRMVDEHDSGRVDHRKALWTMLVLQMWLKSNAPTIE